MSPRAIVAIAATIGVLAFMTAVLAKPTHAAEPSIDRHLVERAVRAMEEQADAQRDLARAVEELGRRCD